MPPQPPADARRARRVSALVPCLPFILALAFASARAGAQTDDAELERIVAAFPAPNAEREHELHAAVVRLGGGAIRALCARLLPPGTGDDTNVRFALSGLATWVHRAGAEAERVLFTRAVAEGLAEAGDKDVQSFLITRLQHAGGEESVATLGRYLGDERLCDPAARALTSVGGREAAAALLQALPAASGRSRLSLVNALGALASDAAVPLLLEDAKKDDPALRGAALDALASIGAPAAEAAIAAFARSREPAERALGAALLTRFARRQTERGREETARICRAVLAGDAAAPHERCAALVVLAGALRHDAADDLLAALGSGSPELRTVALELLGELPGEGVTVALVRALAGGDHDLREGIIRVLGKRRDPAALRALETALADPAAEVKLAAIGATARIEGESPLPVLLRAMRAARGEDRAALILQLGALGGRDALDAVVVEAASSDAEVREAAARVLADWPETAALAPLARLFATSTTPDHRTRYLSGYLRLVRGARLPQEQALAHYERALEASRTADEKRAVIDALGNLKSLASLAIVAHYFDDEALGADAARAAIRLILPRRSGRGGLEGETTAAALARALELCPDEATKASAREYLARLRGQ